MNRSGSWKISRRTMLKGIGASMALPLLDVMVPEVAARTTTKAATAPLRTAYLYFPNGVATGCWHPEKVAADVALQQLNPWMSPLEPFIQDINLFKNMYTPRGNGHRASTATWLTGGSYDGRSIDAGGTSVDQLIARSIGQQNVLPSLELSTKGEGFFSREIARNNISWIDGNKPVMREVEPRAVFDRMFRSGDGAINRSVVDLVLDDAKRLEGRVSTSDKGKIQEYLESVRSIERRMEFAQNRSLDVLNAGELSDSLVRPEAGIPTNHDEYIKQMMDMIVLAFWADATRVSTFMLDHGQSNRYFNFIDGVKGTWHALSHYKIANGRTEDDDGITSWSSSESKRDQYSEVVRWHTEQVAYLLGRLKSIPEGDGNLLDNSMILYGSGIADGDEHGERDIPLIMAGGGGKTIKTGRQIAFREEQSLSNLHHAILERMDVHLDRFADSDQPMTEIDA